MASFFILTKSFLSPKCHNPSEGPATLLYSKMLGSIHQNQKMLFSTSAAIACFSVSLGCQQARVVDGEFPAAGCPPQRIDGMFIFTGGPGMGAYTMSKLCVLLLQSSGSGGSGREAD